MIRRTIGIALALALALALAAPTARAAEGARELTLDEALAMARRANRSLIVERWRVTQAQTAVDQAWSALFPTLFAQGRYTRNYKEVLLGFNPTGPGLLVQPLNQLDGIVSLTMPLIAPAAYPALTAVKKNVESIDANAAGVDATVLFTVAQTFYAAAIYDEVLTARRSAIEVAQATLTNAQTRFQAGTVTKVDVDRAELALVRAQQAELEARYNQDLIYRSLGTLIQAEGAFHVRAPDRQEVLAPETGDLNLALQLRPEFRSLRAAAEAADATARARGWQWAPTLSAFGNARKFNYDNFAFDRYSWALGAQLDWVVYDGGTRDAQRHQAAAQAAQAQAQAQVLADSVRDDIANSRAAIATKMKALEAAQRSVELARETLGLIRTQYEAGSATQIDLLAAQDSLVVNDLGLAQARFDVAVAHLTLRRAVGTFPGPGK